MILMVMPTVHDNPRDYQSSAQVDKGSTDFTLLASAGGNGSRTCSVAYMSRQITNEAFSILNNYENPGIHTDELDLTAHHRPGWTLFGVTVNVDNITAAPEREFLVTPEVANYIMIQNDSGQVTDVLYQEFYNQPHDGRLDNYSLGYRAPYYSSDLGDAYLGVRNNFSDPQSNTTGWVTPFSITLSDVVYTHDTSSDGAILNGSTYYYVVIDGTKMTGFFAVQWYFNTVHWRSSSLVEGLETGYHLRPNTWDTYTGIIREEAELNYTYTPWNKTADAPFVYTAPEQVSLTGNASTLAGDSWFFSSDDNITTIIFHSNQSAFVHNNLTLWYKQSAFTANTWKALVSGGSINWNATTNVTYLVIPGQVEHYLNVSKPNDWTPTGFYNSSNLSIDYGNYTDLGIVVQCNNMTNGTWTLTFTAHNHVTAIDSLETVSILEVLDITTLVKDASLANTTTGSTNLTIWQGSTMVFKPANQSVLNGAAHYAWSIAANTSDNGTYRIEVFWANGTEAGYLAEEIVVFYPTTLEAADYSIDAYTNNSFSIIVYYNDTFTPQPLTGASSAVNCSFDGGMNTSMIDQGNGWWNATIFTTAKAPGTYNVTVYAEGFAIENQTAVIWATLTHETLPLTCAWSMPLQDNITYVEQTNLTVRYQFFNATSVPGAKVNVTIAGMGTWQLHYDPISEIYWMQFNGSDFTTGFGTFTLNVSAWKTGHEAQFNDTVSLEVRLAPTTMTLDWSSIVIDYLGQIDLTVNYTCDETSSPVPAASPNMNISINGGTPIAMTASGSYWIANLTGVFLDLGTHSVVVQAWAYGYVHQTNNTYSLTVNNVTTNELAIVWDPANVTIPYISRLNLTVDYTYGSNDVPLSAIVNVTIDGHTYDLNYSAGLWRGSIRCSDIGVGLWEATVRAWLYGYEPKSNITSDVNITLAANSFIVYWEPLDLNVTYVEQVNLTVGALGSQRHLC
jgi:hypothetical protein